MSTITIYEYALMSADVYSDTAINPALAKFDWQRDNTIACAPFDHGFFARLYYKPTISHYVLALRGTLLDQLGTVFADAQFAFGDRPTLYKQAVAFYTDVCQALKEGIQKAQANVSTTGHSLGGIMAKLLGVDYDLMTVAFNAPGIGDMSGVVSGQPHRNILNIDSREGAINKFGPSIGQTIKINVKEGNEACKIADDTKFPVSEVECVYKKHSIDDMVSSLLGDPRVADMTR
jgi:hypothetical protein